MRQLMAAWMVIDERDVPMNPRLLGKPGVGKTTMAFAAGKRLGREVYITASHGGHSARGSSHYARD